jgi:hypothetical protein
MQHQAGRWGRRAASTAVAAWLVATLVAGPGCSSDGGSTGDETSAVSEADDGGGDVPGEDVARPTVSGPINGGAHGVPFNPMPTRVADEYDYVEREHFVSGEATAYQLEGEPRADGRWTVSEAGTAEYRTRILVRYPSDSEDFDGTVFVEWLNVTAGMDSDPEFGGAYPELLRSGSAYVGVSAQKVGQEGGGAIPIEIPGMEIQGLKQWDPERYGSLTHPGDRYSYDMFSQVAQAIRRPGDVDILDGRTATHVIAMGESQSGSRMLTYLNAVHPLAGIYDGFLVHSRGAGGAPLDDNPSPLGDGRPTHVRGDLDEPVLQFVTETDLFGVLGFHPARQADTEQLRTWEVAGTAHADQNFVDYGVESGRVWAPDATVDLGAQCASINDGPHPEVLRAAVAALRTWVVDGEAPPEAPPLEVEGAAIVRDEHGIAVGGIRTPAVDAPISVLTGEAQPNQSVLCLLFGGVTPLDAATLVDLYPTHQDYVDAVTESADAAVHAGFLLRPEADEIVATAEESSVPG